MNGVRVGPYILEGELGAGGMARVYLARAPGGGRCAVKRLDAAVADDEARGRFMREASIRIDHPNVIKVTDAGVDDGNVPWIALELLDGETLETRLRRGPLSVEDAVDVGVQLARGLGAVHAHSIVHRDLKPSNVFITTSGVVKILDFGIALASRSASRFTTTGTVIGTPWYLSPEQAHGDRQLDERVDVWALGALLYECLAGRGPFERDSALATVLAILREEPDPLPRVAPAAPTALWELVRRCLSKQRGDRPGRIAEVEKELGEVLVCQSASVEVPAPSMGSSDIRMVALIVASGVRHVASVRRAVISTDGVTYALYDGRVIGLWGALYSHGDEAMRAVRAALAAQRSCARIALVLGRVKAAGERLEGEALVVAETLGASSAIGVLVDDVMRRAVMNGFETEHIEGGIHRVIRERPGTVARTQPPDAPPASMEDEATPLVGRKSQLVQIEAALEASIEERRARGVMVIGAAGAGKSRLLRAVQDLAQERDVTVIAGRAESFGDRGALALFRDAMGRAVVARARARGLTKQEVIGAVLRDTPQRVGSIAVWIGVDNDLRPTLDADALDGSERVDEAPQVEQARLFVWDALRAWASERPVVLLLEDLHWADEPSIALVADLLASFGDVPFFVLASARPEIADREHARVFRGDRLELGALSRAAVGELCRAVLRRDPPPAFVQRVLDHTGGNPLFVEQVLYELRESGEAAIDAGLPLPASVAAVVQARADRISSGARELCRIASVVGRAFVASVAVEVAGERAELDLERLVEARFLTRRALANGEPEYRVSHAIVSEAIYRGIADDARRVLHSRVAHVLANRADAESEEVSEHFARAGDHDRAAALLERAVIENDARDDFASVLRCSTRLEELGGAKLRVAEVTAAVSNALRAHGKREDALRLVDRVALTAATDRERVLVARLRVLAADAPDEAEAEAVVALVERTGDAIELAQLLNRLFVVALKRRRTSVAVAYLERLRHLAAGSRDDYVRGLSARAHAFEATFRGQAFRAFEANQEAAMLFRRAGRIGRAIGAEGDAADCYNRIGACDEALDKLGHVEERALAIGNVAAADHARLNSAYALVRLGRREDALRALESVAGRSAVPSDVVAVYRARALSDRPASVLATLEGFAADSWAFTRSLAQALNANALLSLGHRDRALAAARDAMRIRDELEQLPQDDGDVFLSLVRTLAAEGLEGERRQTLSRALAWIEGAARQMQDGTWADRYLQSVPSHAELIKLAREVGLDLNQ